MKQGYNNVFISLLEELELELRKIWAISTYIMLYDKPRKRPKTGDIIESKTQKRYTLF